MIRAQGGPAGVEFVPMPIEGFGHQAKLDEEVAGQVLWSDLAAFFPPKAEQRGLIIAHDGPGIRTTDEAASFAESANNSLCMFVGLSPIGEPCSVALNQESLPRSEIRILL
jgi:hypothetical protein